MIRTRRHRCRSPTSRPSLWRLWYQTLSCRFSTQRSLASKCHHHKLTLYVGYNGHDQVSWIHIRSIPRCMILAFPTLLICQDFDLGGLRILFKNCIVGPLLTYRILCLITGTLFWKQYLYKICCELLSPLILWYEIGLIVKNLKKKSDTHWWLKFKPAMLMYPLGLQHCIYVLCIRQNSIQGTCLACNSIISLRHNWWLISCSEVIITWIYF